MWFRIVLMVALTMGLGIPDANTQEVKSDVDETGFLYETQNRRDPFVPLVRSEKNAPTRDVPVEQGPPTARALKLLGIMYGEQGYHAMIQNSRGTRYIVTPGDVVHSEGIEVKQIAESHLVFEYVDNHDGHHAHEVVLSFRD